MIFFTNLTDNIIGNAENLKAFLLKIDNMILSSKSVRAVKEEKETKGKKNRKGKTQSILIYKNIILFLSDLRLHQKTLELVNTFNKVTGYTNQHIKVSKLFYVTAEK